MRGFLLGVGGSVLLACGGNVVVDGNPAAASGAGGAGDAGGAGATGQTGGGGGSCAALVSAFQAAYQAAVACDGNASTQVCSTDSRRARRRSALMWR